MLNVFFSTVKSFHRELFLISSVAIGKIRHEPSTHPKKIVAPTVETDGLWY